MQTTDIDLQSVLARERSINLDRVLCAEQTLDFWGLSHADAWELRLRFEKAGNVAAHNALALWFLLSFRKSLCEPQYV